MTYKSVSGLFPSSDRVITRVSSATDVTKFQKKLPHLGR